MGKSRPDHNLLAFLPPRLLTSMKELLQLLSSRHNQAAIDINRLARDVGGIL